MFGERGGRRNRKTLELFVKERNEAILSLDVTTFRRFYRKWVDSGFYYPIELPYVIDDISDNLLEITLRKMVLALEDPPEDKLEEAKAWLLERGYSLEPFL